MRPPVHEAKKCGACKLEHHVLAGLYTFQQQAKVRVYGVTAASGQT